MSMNIKSMSFTELVKIKVKVDAEIEFRAAADRSRLIDALGRLRTMSSSRKRNGASHPLAGKKLRPKYRNPKNRAETWAGRGNRPRWLVKALKAGKRVEAFAVK